VADAEELAEVDDEEDIEVALADDADDAEEAPPY